MYFRKYSSITYNIILRKEIPGNHGLLKVTSTLNKVAYAETWNIQRFDGIYMPARHILKPLEKSPRL